MVCLKQAIHKNKQACIYIFTGLHVNWYIGNKSMWLEKSLLVLIFKSRELQNSLILASENFSF